MKRCTKCGEEKVEGEFYTQRNGYTWTKCRVCVRKRVRSYQRGNREKHLASRRRWGAEVGRWSQALSNARQHAKRNGHISCNATSRELEAAFTGKCHVCQVPEIECNHRLRMDHCHETGEFRGWLCHECNVAASLLKDSPEIMRKLVKYIERSKMEGSCVNDLREDGFEFFN